MYFNQLGAQVELYLETLRSKNYSAETIKNYNASISKFIKFGLAKELAELDPDTVNRIVEKYQSYLATSKNYSYATVNQYITNLKPFFNNLGLGFKVKKVNTEVNPEIKYLTLKEIEEVLSTIRQSGEKPL